jgi:transcriptional regulator with XRE-family HTH domain
MCMAIANPKQAPGLTLRAYREFYGVSRQELAKRLGKHRNTLSAWERATTSNDATRVALYERTVDEIVRERLGGTAA